MGIFSQQKQTMPQTFDSRTPQKQQYDQFLANYVSQYGGQYQPGKAYGGQRTAPLSRFEGRGLDEFLMNYLNAPGVSSELGDVRGLLQKTVTGGFDPGTSDYYQAFRGEAGLNQKRAIDALNAELGSRNKFFSSEAVQKTGDITEATSIALNKAMAELADRERGRSLQAAPLAANLEDFISKIPLQKAQAATSVGALPRLLEQNDLESLYQDFIRRQKEGSEVVGAGSGITSNFDVIPGTPAGKSTFESFIAPLLMQAIPALMTGGASLPFTGAAAGAAGASGAVPGLAGAFGNQGGFWANTGY